MEKHRPTEIFIPGQVIFNPELTHTEAFLWWFINDLSTRKGSCQATNAHLGHLMHRSASTISQGIAKLKKQGYIETEITTDGRRLIYLRPDAMKKHEHHLNEFNERWSEPIY